jgi:hypothetical protein
VSTPPGELHRRVHGSLGGQEMLAEVRVAGLFFAVASAWLANELDRSASIFEKTT